MTLDRIIDMSGTVGSGDWEGVDEWWDTYAASRSLVTVPSTSILLDDRWLGGQWETLEPWWDLTVESQRDGLAELRAVLELAQRRWSESASRFDEDPLAIDWASAPRHTGPLWIGQEENWSQWLAHIVRSGPPSFSRRLFGDRFDRKPLSVEREVRLAERHGTDRRADVLVFYGDRGVSIEVKRDDDHYEKTRHTASLVESQFPLDWEHVLLLPRYKRGVLRRTFGREMEERTDGPSLVHSEQSSDVIVLNWQDVSEALRDVLLTEPGSSPHWEASAYLLCTLIEQKVARFVPKPVVDQIAETRDVVRVTASTRLASDDVDDQVAYLRRTTVGGGDE